MIYLIVNVILHQNFSLRCIVLSLCWIKHTLLFDLSFDTFVKFCIWSNETFQILLNFCFFWFFLISFFVFFNYVRYFVLKSLFCYQTIFILLINYCYNFWITNFKLTNFNSDRFHLIFVVVRIVFDFRRFLKFHYRWICDERASNSTFAKLTFLSYHIEWQSRDSSWRI